MADKIQFFPLDATYRVVEGKAVINMYGRTVDGNQVCILDNSFEPYFYAMPKENANISEKLEKIRIEGERDPAFVTKTEILSKKYLGKDAGVVKVYTNLPGSVPAIREVVKSWDIVQSTYEFDIPFARRYMIDRNITPMVLYEATGDFINQKSKVPVFSAEKIEQAGTDTLHNPKILAFDIETYSQFDMAIDAEKNPIIMLSFYGENFKKVFVWKKFRTDSEHVEFVENESELIQKFKETIESYKPDILTGYFSDGFDLPYIKTRAEKNRVKLDLGFDYSEMKLKTGKETTVAINGIIHLDIFKFIKRVMGVTLETFSYDLNSVASELLEEGKHEVSLKELPHAWDNSHDDLDGFCKYCLHDSYLTYNLAAKMMPTIIEMVKIVGIPMHDASRVGFSQLVEWYVIKQAQQFNEIIPNKPGHNEVIDRRLHTYEGAFVYEPKPGLFKDIVVFDFRSLYPSIISSHNIDPGTLNCDCCKEKGFMPTLIEDLITRRMRIKEIIKEKKSPLMEARSQSLKLLANSFYGYL